VRSRGPVVTKSDASRSGWCGWTRCHHGQPSSSERSCPTT
jgi:hypothetical protein